MIVFGFDRSPRGHRFTRAPGFPMYTLGYLFAGTVQRTVAGSTTMLRAGHLWLALPDSPYDACVTEQVAEIHVMFTPRPEWAALMRWPQWQPGTMLLDLAEHPGRQAIEATLNELRGYQSMDSHWRDQYYWNGVERVFLLMAHLQESVQSSNEVKLECAAKYAREHLAEQLCVATLARVAGMSASHFAHLFRQMFDCGPMKYVEHCRLRHAQELLIGTNLQVQEIARRVGYPSTSHFSTHFRRFSGQPPRAYRRCPTQSLT